MIVKIFVEGKSDKKAMEELLAPLIYDKNNLGVGINFYTAKTGDAKKFLLLTVPKLAVDIICNQPDVIVAVLPDLYPKNKGFPHETFAEMKAGIMERFSRALKAKDLADDSRFRERFKVFCFQHDLEVLILAAEEQLKKYLEVDDFKISWQIPV